MKASYVWALLIMLVAVGWIGSGVLATGVTRPGDGATAPEPAPAEVAQAPAADTATADAELPRVRVRTVRARQTVRQIVVNAHTEVSRQVVVKAQTTGVVADLPVAEGAAVAERDTLARLSMEDRAARQAEAEAAIAERELEFEAASRLSQQAFASRVTLASRRAALESARAMEAAIALDIGRTRIRAPFDGVLESRAVEIGDYLTAGDPVATFVDLDPILVVAQVSERQIGRVRQGAVGSVRLIDGRTVEGAVSFIASVTTAATRTFRVELEVPNPNRSIPAGMTAEMTLPLDAQRAHQISSAILTLDDQGRIGVKTVDPSDTVRFHPVTIVRSGSDGLWVSDLPDPARLITVGQEFVGAGMTVIPVPDTDGGDDDLAARQD